MDQTTPSGQVQTCLQTEAMGAMTDAQMDYYGKRVAAASSDNTVHIWDITDGNQKPAGQLKGHEGPVWKVSWAHPKFGSLVATCSYDMRVIVWKETPPNSTAWQIAYQDTSHNASVNDVQFCPWEFGLRLACASSDGTVSVLTYSATECQWRRSAFPAHPGGAQALSWMPVQYRDGAVAPVVRLVTGGYDGSVKVWKCEGETWSEESTRLPALHTDWVRAVAWRPTPGTSIIASGGYDKSVIIWAQEMEGQPWRQVHSFTVADKVESLAWSVTGSILAVSYGEGETELYKEALDGRYEKVGMVNEAGFVEVPSSISPPAPQQVYSGAAEAAAPPPAPVTNELAMQQQSVLDSFGGF